MSKGKSGSKYIAERNEHLYRAYREAVLDGGGLLTMDEICAKIVDVPCPRFWISTEQALKIISSVRRGLMSIDDMSGLRRGMIRLIMHRAYLIMKSNDDIPYYYAVEKAVYSPSPCFFLRPGSAKTILCNYKKCRRLKLR